MLKIRIWRFLVLFCILYVFFLVTFFQVFSGDDSKNDTGQSDITKKEKSMVHPDSVKSIVSPDIVGIKSEQESLVPIMREGVLGNYEENEVVKAEGPGEYGQGIKLTGDDIKDGQESVAEYGFNQVASDKISLDRHPRDTRYCLPYRVDFHRELINLRICFIDRPAECKYWHYPSHDKLPKASVVLVFHNEGWSTFVRTIHSVINTSPKSLLKDIVLVDDYSDKEHLTVRLPEYMKRWNGLVKYIRTKNR